MASIILDTGTHARWVLPFCVSCEWAPGGVKEKLLSDLEEFLAPETHKWYKDGQLASDVSVPAHHH